jgi:pimeloyl-ACP methyl ester carboxylesterase
MSRPHLVLLHGALGTGTQFRPLLPFLTEKFDVHTLDLEGHGASPLKNRPLRLEHFAENVITWLDNTGIETVNIFGHSLGGHISLYLAHFFPERITGVFTLGTKFCWTPDIVEKEKKLLLPDKIREKVPQFARQLQERHVAAGWEPLLEKLRDLQDHLGRNNPLPDDNIRTISQGVRIGVGDRDKTAGLDESIRIYHLLQKGEFQVFPGTPHPLEKVSMQMLADAIWDFFL